MTTNRLNGHGKAGPRIHHPGYFEPGGEEAPKGLPPIPLFNLNAVPAAPFPLKVLPGVMREYVEQSALSTNTPPDFTAVHLVGLAGGAIGNSRRLQITDSYHESACVWAVTIGRPGTGKSTPLIKYLGKPFYEIEEAFDQANAKRMADFERSNPRALSKKPANRPPMQRCLVGDATVESVVGVLADNPRGGSLIRDELAGFFNGLNQYKDQGKGGDVEHYLEIFSGSPVMLDRVTQGGKARAVRHPFLSIHGTTQPDSLHKFRKKRQSGHYVDDGFLDRFLFSYPEELPAKEEEWRSLSSDRQADWRKVVQSLFRLKMEGRQGSKRPRDLRFSPDAREAWVDATREHAAELNDPDFPRYLDGPWAKLVKTYLGRLSLIVQLLRRACGEAEDEEVDGASVRAATQLVRYFKAHARRCYRVIGANPRFEKADVALQWLRDRRDVSEFSRADLWNARRKTFEGLSAHAHPNDLNGVVDLLVEYRYLERVERPEGERRGPGRPGTERYRVNPLWDRAEQSEQSEQLPRGAN